MLSVIIMFFIFLALNMKNDNQSFFYFAVSKLKNVNDGNFAHNKVLRIKYAKLHFSIFKIVLISQKMLSNVHYYFHIGTGCVNRLF